MAILRFFVLNAMMGSAIGVLFGIALLVTNTLGLRVLVLGSSDVVATTIIFLMGAAMTFTPFVVVTAVALSDDRLVQGPHQSTPPTCSS
jgi:hypothetical protein